MDVWRFALQVGIPYATVAGAAILISIWHEPRIWLHDMPATFRARVPPKNGRERRLTWVYSILVTPIILGVPISAAIWFRWKHPEAGFLDLAAVATCISLIFAVVDLVIIDWLILCFWTPPFVVIPGTEGAPEYKDYRFHFRGFLIGLPITVAVGFIAGAVSLFVAYLSA